MVRQRLSLSPREVAVLERHGNGDATDTLAVRLGISKRTAEDHMRHAIRKLGAFNRTHAVALAVGRGLIQILDN